MIHSGAVARAGQGDGKLRAKGCTRAGVERNDPVRHDDAFVDIIGDQDDGLLLLAPDADNLVLQVGTGQGIERRQRLVEQQDLGAGSQCARHIDALAHATGKLGRVLVDGWGEVHHGDILLNPGLALCLRRVLVYLVHGQRDILAHRHPGHQRVALKHDAAFSTRSVYRLAIQQHLAAVGCNQASDEGDERRFPAAGEADDCNKLAVSNPQVDVFQYRRGLGATAVGFAQVLEFKNRRSSTGLELSHEIPWRSARLSAEADQLLCGVHDAVKHKADETDGVHGHHDAPQ